MILLKKPTTDTNRVETFSIIGKTTCGLKLAFEAAICFDIFDLPPLSTEDEIAKIAKEKIESSCNLSIANVESARVFVKVMHTNTNDSEEVVTGKLTKLMED